MSRYTINIGLANPKTGTENDVAGTLRLAFCHIKDITQLSIQESNTERTLVIDFNTLDGDLYALSVALNQDCVALYAHDIEMGLLTGPKSAQWGEFNKEYFLFNKEIA